jgi:UMF1 family MFS transporter
VKLTRSLYSWALYDFANTIFSAVVLTFYFPLYLTGLAGRNLQLGLATTGAMIVAGFVVPWLGALSDRTGKTKAYLIRTTVLSVLFTGLLSFFTTIPLLMGGFLVACFFFHASLVFYYSLLPVVETPERQGFASGLGTALGYLGVLFAIPIAHLVDTLLGRRFVFLTAGALFFLFSLPLFFWVPEREVLSPSSVSFKLFGTESAKVFRTVKSFLKNRRLLLFFLGNFFVMEAMNTVIFWLVVYMARVFNPPQTLLTIIFLGLNLGAFLFGFVAGFFTDRAGSHKTLLAASASLFVTILALGLTRNLWVFVAVALTGGAFGLAGTWTAARKRVLELAPAEEVGEYFGLYNLTTKISVAGSLIFSILADRFGFQVALLSLTIPSGLGLFLLWKAGSEKLGA